MSRKCISCGKTGLSDGEVFTGPFPQGGPEAYGLQHFNEKGEHCGLVEEVLDLAPEDAPELSAGLKDRKYVGELELQVQRLSAERAYLLKWKRTVSDYIDKRVGKLEAPDRGNLIRLSEALAKIPRPDSLDETEQ